MYIGQCVEVFVLVHRHITSFIDLHFCLLLELDYLTLQFLVDLDLLLMLLYSISDGQQ